jgi:hypothetical protein
LRVRNLNAGICHPLHDLQPTVARAKPSRLDMTGWLSDTPMWKGWIDTFGKVHSDDENWVIEDVTGRDYTPLATFLSHEPWSVFFADGSSTIGAALFQGCDDYPDLSSTVLTVRPFTNVDIKAEAKKPQPDKRTIKDYMIEQFTQDPAVEYIVDDDRAGEVADLVVVHKPDVTRIRNINLVHLKYSSEDTPGTRVADLYEVLGQAGRGVVWLQLDALARRLSERLESGSRVVTGDTAQFSRLLKEWSMTPTATSWSITVVQPGLRGAKANSKPNIKVMLSDILDWIAQHDAEFRVIAHN